MEVHELPGLILNSLKIGLHPLLLTMHVTYTEIFVMLSPVVIHVGFQNIPLNDAFHCLLF